MQITMQQHNKIKRAYSNRKESKTLNILRADFKQLRSVQTTALRIKVD